MNINVTHKSSMQFKAIKEMKVPMTRNVPNIIIQIKLTDPAIMLKNVEIRDELYIIVD